MDYNTKQCFKCKKSLPMDNNYYYRKKASKDGWDPNCKKCWGKKEYGVRNINATYRAKTGHKFCSICKLELPYKKFNKSKEIKDGYSGQCRVCKNESHRIYYSNPDVKRERYDYYKRWRKQYYTTSAGKALNKKHIHLRRSRKADAIYNYSESIWFDTLEHFNNECAYCGDATKDLQQEHVIPLSKGGYYTKQNIIPACQFCNISKHNRNLMDWYPNQPNYSKDRLKKINKWAGIKNNIQQLSIF